MRKRWGAEGRRGAVLGEYHWVVIALVGAAGPVLAGCTAGDATAEAAPAAVVEEVAGASAPVITLTESGAARIGVETAAVLAGSPLVVPYQALLYLPDGGTWVYTSPEPLTYVRQPVTVELIDGDDVILTDGPVPGTEIVTVAVAELYGAELGIGQ